VAVEPAFTTAQAAQSVIASIAAGSYSEEGARVVTAKRSRLPDTRRSITHKFNVSGHEGYLTVGLFDDGQPGELFITMSKEGSTIGGLMDSLGTATSISLQYGVPVSSLVAKFSHQRFEPAGITENPDIPFAKSLVDYIFRWMGMQFIPGYLEANSPRAQFLRDTPPEPVPQQIEQSPSQSTVPLSTRAPVPTSSRPPLSVGQASAQPASMPTKPGKPIDRDTALSATLSVAMDSVSDSPACDVCGTITVRSGTCYKCLNCGNSMGCS
jgi:ribonucleoside-diphosphate reductase alpha chain